MDASATECIAREVTAGYVRTSTDSAAAKHAPVLYACADDLPQVTTVRAPGNRARQAIVEKGRDDV